MTPPRVSTPRVASYVEAHAPTESDGALACQIAMDLIDAREQIVKLDAALDAALAVIEQYHAILSGAPRARVAG